jgi:multidrug efflux pump subunit AcrA (membrane-fusion protein)
MNSAISRRRISIPCRIERLHANIKDQVQEGQVIAELEKADLEATMTQRRAEACLALDC